MHIIKQGAVFLTIGVFPKTIFELERESRASPMIGLIFVFFPIGCVFRKSSAPIEIQSFTATTFTFNLSAYHLPTPMSYVGHNPDYP